MENYSNMSNSSHSTDIEIGGLVYFLTYISDYLPYVILTSVGFVIGLLGNAIIMATIIFNKDLHSPTYVLIFNLSLADFIISGFIDPFTLVGVFYGKEYFSQRPYLCPLIASLCLIACITSLTNIGFLAINRYIHICHHSIYNRIFGKKLTYLYCVFTWIIGILIDVPNFAGWGGHYYDEKTLSCLWNRLASQSYSIFFPMSSIIVPCLAILYCYVRIFIYSHRSKVRSHATNNIRQSLRLAKGLFISFMLFACCWIPFGFLVMIDFADKAPRGAVMFTMTLAHLNSSFNPIVYAVSNSNFQNGYVALFRRIVCLRPLTEPKSMNITTLYKHKTLS